MKRDFDLLRKILIGIESEDFFKPDFWSESDYTAEQMKEHCNILYLKGYITAYDMSSSLGTYWQPNGLTWEGHDYLDAVRDDNKYHKAVKSLKEKGATLSFELIKTVLTSYAKSHVPGSEGHAS